MSGDFATFCATSRRRRGCFCFPPPLAPRATARGQRRRPCRVRLLRGVVAPPARPRADAGCDASASKKRSKSFGTSTSTLGMHMNLIRLGRPSAGTRRSPLQPEIERKADSLSRAQRFCINSSRSRSLSALACRSARKSRSRKSSGARAAENGASPSWAAGRHRAGAVRAERQQRQRWKRRRSPARHRAASATAASGCHLARERKNRNSLKS
jgi:hypothetical protein